MEIPNLLDSFRYAGKEIKTEWFDVDNLEHLPKVEWHQVYAVCNLNGKVPVVLYDDAHVNLPGGRTEQGETIEGTLYRELFEELNCEVLHWQPIGYQKLTEPGVDHPIYQLRVYAEVSSVGDFVEDIGGEVVGHKLISIEELNNEIGHGKVGERIQKIVTGKFVMS